MSWHLTCIERTAAGKAPSSAAHHPAPPSPALEAARHGHGPLRERSSAAAPCGPGSHAPATPAHVGTRRAIAHAPAAALHGLAAGRAQAHRRNLRRRHRAERYCASGYGIIAQSLSAWDEN